MEITHLVTNGCSWTYCQGLENPKEQGWPTLLAKKLGCEVVNIAVPGTGNRSIMRRTFEYVCENLPTNSKPFFVILWSQYARKEAWYSNVNDFDIIPYPKGNEILSFDNYQKAFLENFNEEDFLRSTILDKIATTTLLRYHNIPYLSCDAFHDNFKDSLLKKVFKRIPNMYTQFNEINNATDLYNISRKYRPLPCGHDGPEAMFEIADTFYNDILNNYSKPIILQNANFLSRKNFVVHKLKRFIQKDWD